jgi:hypothetical protein
MFAFGRAGVAAIVLLAAWAQPLAAAQPTTLTLFSDSDNQSEIVLGNLMWGTGTCPGAGQSGSGTITSLVLFGTDLSTIAAAAGSVKFQNLCADSAGNVTGGSITLPSDLVLPIFNGLALTLSKNTTIAAMNTASGTACQSPPCAIFSGSVTLALPLHDAKGNAPQVQVGQAGQGAALTLQQGKFSLNLQGATVLNASALASGKAQLSGFGFTLNSIDLNVVRDHGQTTQFLLTVYSPQIDVPLPIPGLLTQDGTGIAVKADTLKVNQSGEVQIVNGVAACSGTASQCANGVQIDLASPLGFTLQASQVKFSKPFDGSDSVTGQFKLTGAKLLLPDFLPDDDSLSAGTPQRIVLDIANGGGDWDVLAAPVVTTTAPQDINIGWNGFRVQIPKSTPIVLDFSATAGDSKESGLKPDWQGLYVGGLKVFLPSEFCTPNSPNCAGSSGGSGRVGIDATNLAIGNSGLNVTVGTSGDLNLGATVAGFGATLHSVSFTVANSHIDAKDLKIDANVSLPVLGSTDWGMQLTDSGNFVLSLNNPSLDATLFAGAADIGGIEGIHFDLSSATLKLPTTAGGVGSVMLSGLLTLKTGSSPSDLAASLSGVSVPFKDLGIDTAGHFIVPSIGQFTLSHPVSLDLKVMKIELSSFTAGNDPATNSPYLLFTGGVEVGEGLPASAEVDFDGVMVDTDGGVRLHGLEVIADVADVLRIDASLDHYDAKDAVPPTKGQKDNPVGCFQSKGVGIGCIRGDMQILLNLGSLSLGAQQTGFNFAAAGGAWLFLGSMGLPGGGIPLGQSGINLFGFQGGVGYKAQLAPANEQPDPGGQLGDHDFVVYLNPTLPPADLLFTFGTTIGTGEDNGFNFSAQAVSTVTLDPFMLDFNARAKFQENLTQDFDTADRTAHMDIQYIAPDTLHATAGADLYYQSRKYDVLDAHGSLDLMLSPTETHLYLGWPPDQNPIAVNVGVKDVEQYAATGGLAVHVNGASSDLDHDPVTGSTGAWAAVALGLHVEWLVFSADLNGYLDVSLTPSTSTPPSTPAIDAIAGWVSATGQADFDIFSASAEGTLALAYVTDGHPVTITPPGGNSTQITADAGDDEIVAQGDLEGCGSVFGKSICKSISFSEPLWKQAEQKN